MKDSSVYLHIYKNDSDSNSVHLRAALGLLAADLYEVLENNKSVEKKELINNQDIESLIDSHITGKNISKQLNFMQYNIHGNERYVGSIYTYSDKNAIGISNSYDNESTFADWEECIFNDKILQDSALRYLQIEFYINDVRSTKSQKVLGKIKNQRKIPSGTQGELGFHIYWAFVIPPKGDSLLLGDYFENHDIFLEAPVYKAEKLPGGGTFIQLTEEYDVYGANQDYIDTWLKTYEFFHNHKIT